MILRLKTKWKEIKEKKSQEMMIPNPMFVEELSVDQKIKKTKNTIKISDIVLGDLINTGTFSKVTSATYKNEKVAIKIIKKNASPTTNIIIQEEIAIHSSLKHPNIVKCFGSYEDSCNVYIVLEYVGEDLFEYARRTYPESMIPNNMASIYANDIINAVMYCHANGIIHRDIKTENVVIDPMKNTTKLIDFGLSIRNGNSIGTDRFSGTIYYMAPEMVEGIQQDYRIDIWAIGILIYEMLTGGCPFMSDDNSIITICNRIRENCIYYPTDINDDAKDLITKILISNPYERIELDKALQHDWFNKK
jgi:serine/threonine protein kinase